MIKLMLLEMARNECPEEQYARLGPPDDESIRAACVLHNESSQEGLKDAGNGFPKMPFPDFFTEATFPDNLRLRSGYESAHTKK